MRHLVVIGAQRCGTTYLADTLAAHPHVTMAEPRRPEPKVFLDEAVVRRGRRWYVESYFPAAVPAHLLVEKSTSYLDHASSAARMDEVLGDDLRTLAQLRDPVERAVSHCRFSTAHGVERRPLARALRESLEREQEWDRERFSVSPFAYLSRGHYAAALGPWVERFGGRLRVQFLEELGSPGGELAAMFAWLGLEPPASAPRDPVNRSEGSAPPLEADLVERLRDHFATSDQALRELLGRDLPWDRQED